MAGNSQAPAKKRRGPGKPFKKKDPITGERDPRINMSGPPRLGLSWREILETIGDLDGAQALARAGRIFTDLRKYPRGVTLKELSAISYFIRMINDPSGSLLNAVADRTEGKVPDRVQIDQLLEVENVQQILDAVYGIKKNAENEDQSG